MWYPNNIYWLGEFEKTKKHIAHFSINPKDKTAVFSANSINKSKKEEIEPGIIFLLHAPSGSNSKRQILLALTQRPKSCNQLATELELNWRTVYRHLQILEREVLVLTFNFGERKFYKLSIKGCEVIKMINCKNEGNISFDKQT